MKVIKNYCTHCGHVEFGGLKDELLKVLASFLNVLGFFTLILLVTVGPSFFIQTIVNHILLSSSGITPEDYRNIALNTTTYSGNDAYMFARDFIGHMEPLRYVGDNRLSIYEPIHDVALEGGDCKAMSVYATGIFSSVGFTSQLDCNLEHGHCVSLLYPSSGTPNKDTYAVIDLTGQYFAVYSKYTNFWEDGENYLEYCVGSACLGGTVNGDDDLHNE